MNINTLLPLLMGMNGNGNINETIVKLVTEKSSGTEKNIDPMTILMLGLMSNMNKNNVKNEKVATENIAENNENNQKSPDLSAIEKFTSGNISEALKILINNNNG